MTRLLIPTLLAVVAVGFASRLTAADKPNLVLFLADDHGAAFAGCYGNPAVRTPHLDALANEGTRFTKVFAGSPTCAPSRAVLFTGLYPARNGLMGNHTAAKPGVKSLPTYLQALGYRVVLANKSHVRPESVFPFEPLAATLPPVPGRPRRYRTEGLDTAVVDRFLADHAKTKPGTPLCLVLADSCPHVLWEPNRDYDPAALPLPAIMVDTPVTRAALARYYQDVTTADRHFGDVLASLGRHGFADNTLVVYTADQGAEWPRAKWTLYDAGLRVPFVVRWPGKVTAGGVSDALLSLADVTPTFLELAGGTVPAGLDGVSAKGVLLGTTRQVRTEVYASHTGDKEMNRFPQRGVRDGRYKYILNLHPERAWTTHFTLVPGIPGSHKEVWDTWVERAKTDPAAAQLVAAIERHPAEELYDTEADPDELTNLAGRPEMKPVLETLRAKLAAWRKQQGDENATE